MKKLLCVHCHDTRITGHGPRANSSFLESQKNIKNDLKLYFLRLILKIRSFNWHTQLYLKQFDKCFIEISNILGDFHVKKSWEIFEILEKFSPPGSW